MLTIRCECNQKLRIAAGNAGKTVECAKCKRVFILPDPQLVDAENEIHLKSKLRCTCGLVMHYDVLQAGLRCRCPQCSAEFYVPGGTQPAVATPPRNIQTPAPTQNASAPTAFDSDNRKLVQRELRVARHSINMESTDSNPVGKYMALAFLAGVLVMGIAASLLWVFNPFDNASSLVSGNALGKPNDIAKHTDSPPPNLANTPPVKPTIAPSTSSGNTSTPVNAAPKAPSDPPTPPADATHKRIGRGRVNASSDNFRIGAVPRKSTPVVPTDLETPIENRTLLTSEAEELTEKVVTALRHNSSAELVELMDAELMGNYLFADTPGEIRDRYILGSDFLELIRSTPHLFPSPIVDARACLTKRIDDDFYGFIAVDVMEPLEASDTNSSEKSIQVPATGVSPSMQKWIDDFEQTFEDVRAKLLRAGVEDEKRFNRTPIRHLMERSFGYYALTYGVNRQSKPIVTEIYCLNAPDCIFEQAWETISLDSQPKSFDATRPLRRLRILADRCKHAIGERNIDALYTANLAYALTSLPPKLRKGVVEPTRPKGYPTPAACLSALERVEDVFQEDSRNLLIQSLTAARSGMREKAIDRAMRALKADCSDIRFYALAFQTFVDQNQESDAKEVLQLLKKKFPR